MSAARLPYYQQLSEDEQRRRSTSRGRSGAGHRANGAYHERNSTRRNYSRSRSRSRSVERRRYSRSRSRSTERQRRRNSRHQQQHRHHKDSNDSRSWDADRRERDRDYARRNSYHQRDSRSRSATPPPTSSGSRRHQQQQHGSKQGRIGGSVEDNVDDMRIPLPTNATGKDKAMSAVGAYYNLDTDEPFDKERIHREIEEKLRQTLAREGKIYPPPKPEASHPVFANDGSFMELFKKMQEEQQRPPQQLMMMEQHPHPDAALIAATAAAAAATAALRDQQQQHLDNTATGSGFGALPAIAAGAASSPAAPYIAAAAAGKSAPPPPMVGRRRGGKILKTGVVAKLKAPNERDVDPKDFWSLYLAEVNKYKSNACDTDNGKRPLVK